MSELKKIIFVVGPTAVGKSEVALLLAKKINGEIVSCDSMQIYKEINIASNKPSEQEMKDIAHHLVDIVSVEDEFDVSRFNDLAVSAIKDIHNRGLVPIVVGGSGLYMQILLDGIFEGAPKNQELRGDLIAIAKQKGNESLYGLLQEKDPIAAEKIHQNDLRRIVRVLEVCMMENRRHSELKEERKGLWGNHDISIYCLNCDREMLYDRINKRTDKMFDAGLVDEIRKIECLKLSKTARGLIGIKEVLSYLSCECDLEGAKDLIKQNTRRFAKRQLTWFRRESRARWIKADEYYSINDVVSAIFKGIYSKVE
ncbi:MAG: tRNA (adenosine(37)-N6)-dimethylallyltransferase MiaA [Candidatus Omnitrophica bacterium]|nr:tRNA (adenosine(37)-N6)-dimethylallyltransferase MiaA [Candidatus Omnitrophota bacterium]MBU1996587.1 tRNA (adenosine(37)-N6)-dimethylallyltransferase MiaA [Candidatus Omnitrophota bacterium]MBU4333028.1 tRNA (adenosine(37)-N6)-dimethylallyltransferase MiaA [Candidatus Omnitrophota bacterium]